MNKIEEKRGTPIKRRMLVDGRLKEILLLSVLAFALIFAAWKIFYTDETSDAATAFSGSESERKVSRLLQEIDGVGEADVMICETEDGVQSVVVVCEGARDLQVMMNVREAVAAALGTEEKAVKIYLKKV